MSVIELETKRLLLRNWYTKDIEAFAKMNADPKVMSFYPYPLTRYRSRISAKGIRDELTKYGWGLWVVIDKQHHQFIGVVGLHHAHTDLPFAPCIEIGWRLCRHAWGRGFAIEAARCALNFGFEQLQLPEIVAFTSIAHERSLAIMRKLYLQEMNFYFQHPSLPKPHPYGRHTLYKLTYHEWVKQQQLQAFNQAKHI